MKNKKDLNLIHNLVADSCKTKVDFFDDNADNVLKLAEKIAAGMLFGKKVILFGNGGSAADAQHIAAEFVNRFETERGPLGAIALTTDTSVLTSIANDYSFDYIFSKQMEVLGSRLDFAIGISTSGNSENVYRALLVARDRGLHTVGLLGHDGGKIAKVCDLPLIVKSSNTARIQETHILIGHIVVKLVEEILYGERY